MEANSAADNSRIGPASERDTEEANATNGSEDVCTFCIACEENVADVDCVKLRCGHSFCARCLDSVFTLSMKDETVFPPRCCDSTITLRVARKHLPRNLIKEYEARCLELSTKDRIYCHEATCSAFIAPHSIHNNEAICQKCNARTCKKCRSKWHFGPCSSEEEDTTLTNLAISMSWKRCPDCKTMVEKVDGCSQIL